MLNSGARPLLIPRSEVNGFYEKVIKVKADVAAFPNSFLRVIIFTLARRYIG
jgi:hypothetical protein